MSSCVYVIGLSANKGGGIITTGTRGEISRRAKFCQNLSPQ
jgi:hypothetical protein